MPEPAALSPSTVPTPELREQLVTTEHRLELAGRTLEYSATCGTVLLRLYNEPGDEKAAAADADKRGADKPRAEFFFIAYTLKGEEAGARAVTFSFNGGPGSSSVWLHLGLLGPQRVVTDDTGLAPPPPYALQDNEYTLLTHSDLVLTAAKIFSRKFNVPMPRYRNEHFCTVFRKKTCELTWKLFHNELANSVKYNTRDPYEPTVSFQILTHYVGEFYGHMLIRYSQSSPIKMLYGDFNDDIRYNRIKNSLMLMRPHIFCINNLHTPRQKIRFEELMKKYYTGFF